MPSSGSVCDGLAQLAPVVLITRLYWRPASGLRPSPPLQPRRLQSLRLAPPFMHPTCRRYNSPACAFLLYPPVFLIGEPTAYAANCSGQFSQRFNLRLAPSAALSGRASNGLSACAVFPPSARTGDQLQLSSRAAHLARPQCNSWLAPQVTRLWLRRQSNPWLTPVVASFGKAGDQFPDLGGCRISGLRRLPAALYFRSLSPSVESWLVFRLAPDSSSLAQLSCDPESRRMLALWACGLNRAACATRSLSQACGELSTSTGPCIVG